MLQTRKHDADDIAAANYTNAENELYKNACMFALLNQATQE